MYGFALEVYEINRTTILAILWILIETHPYRFSCANQNIYIYKY